MPQIKVTLSIGLNTMREDVIDIDDDDYAACETEDQKRDLINEYWQDWANNFIDGGSELLEE